MINLEINQWYWLTIPSEGDSWVPIFVNTATTCDMDGNIVEISDLDDCIIVRAVMPVATTSITPQPRIKP